jgi:hypothetical protein
MPCVDSASWRVIATFDICVAAAELKSALQAMRGRFPETSVVSEDAAKYRLIHFNLNPEVFAPKGSRGSRGRLGLALRDVAVTLCQRP